MIQHEPFVPPTHAHKHWVWIVMLILWVCVLVVSWLTALIALPFVIHRLTKKPWETPIKYKERKPNPPKTGRRLLHKHKVM